MLSGKGFKQRGQALKPVAMSQLSSPNPSTKSGPEPIASRIEAQAVLRGMRTAEFELHELEATRDRLIQEHAAKLVIPAGIVQAIEDVKSMLTQSSARLQEWAEKNRKTEFGEKQELELVANGWLKFNAGRRSVDLRAGWDWKKVKAAMLKAKKVWGKWIRSKPEIDKAKILADTAQNGDIHNPVPPKLDPAKLKSIGLKIVQEETFSIEINTPAVDVTIGDAGDSVLTDSGLTGEGAIPAKIRHSSSREKP